MKGLSRGQPLVSIPDHSEIEEMEVMLQLKDEKHTFCSARGYESRSGLAWNVLLHHKTAGKDREADSHELRIAVD